MGSGAGGGGNWERAAAYSLGSAGATGGCVGPGWWVRRARPDGLFPYVVWGRDP